MQDAPEKRDRPEFAGVVLVAWSPPSEDIWAQVSEGLGRAAQALFTEAASVEMVSPGGVWEQLVTHENRLVYCSAERRSVAEAVLRAVDEGAQQIVIVPMVFALDHAPPADAAFDDILSLVKEVERRHPEIAVYFVGPPFDQETQISRILSQVSRYEPDAVELIEGVVVRGFDSDWSLFAQFMNRLQAVLPPNTKVAIRGSAVVGYSYTTGQPFDSLGRGTSDLDLVLVGEEAMAAWKPEAFYVPEINTMPLSDAMPDIAPRFEGIREELQELVGRPVNIQAMPKWFLDLRRVVQGIPYVFLDTFET